MKIKRMVISGINLSEGGPLSVYHDLCDSLLKSKNIEDYRITLFVHKRELFVKYEDFFEIIELPKSRKSWVMRLFYEYLYFYVYSRNQEIDIWLSMHDITPNVVAKKRITYCHNATFCFKANLNIWKFDKKVYLFSKFYKYLYAINIRKNKHVIVQQNWIANEFMKAYKVASVYVLHPNVNINIPIVVDNSNSIPIFVYPTFPRAFKNIETVCEAIILLKKMTTKKFQFWVTIDKNQNKYAQYLVEKYSYISEIKFVGLKTREQVYEMYNESSCLIFPSKLETWGLPITEYKFFNKPIIVADEKYAIETIGNYNKAIYFESDNTRKLAGFMLDHIEGVSKYHVRTIERSAQMVSSWDEALLGEEK